MKIAFNDEARVNILKGINLVADAVKVTIGPKGRNVAIDNNFINPVITNDGVSIAKAIEPKKKLEKIGSKIVREIASKTNDKAGDGTTTATILTQALANEGIKYITMGGDAMGLKNALDLYKNQILKELDKMTKKVDISDIKSLEQVANISAESKDLAKIITDTIVKTGKDGVISIEEGKDTSIKVEHKNGLEIDRGYISPYMCSDMERMEATYKDVKVFVTNQTISTLEQLFKIIEFVKDSTRFVIIANDITGPALDAIVYNNVAGTNKILGIKAPGFGDNKLELLEDIASVVDAKVFVDNVDKEVSIEYFGNIDTITSTKDRTIINGSGNTSKQIAKINFEMNGVDDYEKERLSKRIAKLTNGVAVIKVGAETETEMKYLKLKIEDAVNATKAALTDGIVYGGGSALVKISRKLKPGKNNSESVAYDIVKKALEQPFRQIVKNAGKDDSVILVKILEGAVGYDAKKDNLVEDMIKAGIIDPVKVTKNAVSNSISAVSTLLTTEVIISK